MSPELLDLIDDADNFFEASFMLLLMSMINMLFGLMDVVLVEIA